jgi:hypothetical protein
VHRWLVERWGIEPQRACVQGKPGHLSPPRRTHRGSRTLTPRRAPRPQRGPSTGSGRWACCALGGSRTHTSEGHRALNPGRLPVPPREHLHPHRDLNPGDRTENPAGCHYLMGAGCSAPWTGLEPVRPGLKVRVGSQQPPRRCALRTGLEPVISRSTGGRPLQLDRQSLAEGARIELARPYGPSVFETAAVAGLRLVPPRSTKYAGQDSNLHAREGTWSTARRANQLPSRRMCRSAGSPTSSPWDAAAAGHRSRPPSGVHGSGACLMLSTVQFAPTPHHWGLGRERPPHGRVTASPVPRCSPASRPGRGSGARGTFHDSHGRRDSNPHPPVLETGALPVELRPFAAVVVPLCWKCKGAAP